MAKAGKPRHSGSTRTPPVINHEPLSKDDEKSASNATKADKQAGNNLPIKQALPKPQNDKQVDKNAASMVENAASSPDKSQQTDAPKKMTQDEKASSKQISNNENTPKTKSGSPLLSGVAGGVIALLIAGGLQWSGILPTPDQNAQNNYNSQITTLQEQVNTLKQSLEAQENKGNIEYPDAATLQNIANKANEATNTAKAALSKVDENAQALSTLTTAMTGLEAQSGDTNALATLSAQITSLEDKATLTDTLNKRVAENQGTLDQIRTRLNTIEVNIAEVKNMNERLAHLEANEKAISASITNLQQNAETFESRILSANTADHARLIAANALKDAVDRGGSYVNELQTFEKVAPQDISLELLNNYAKTGLPTSAELSQQFTKVADQIAATQYAAPEDAGIADKLWANARQLVITRPIGNVEGSTPGDIAARMEVAIQKGDYEQALAQWQTLPENAKTISNDFIKIMTARRDANRLINQLITYVTQQQTAPEKTTREQATPEQTTPVTQ